ncbi:hypothetical protein V5N11_000494 [Cardamine amara subsp. amara]|uniref:WIYLD domain-containing protein n=1 Tax=Cardamine amara subsp. amara TaxID=228776 RepID=A0ABD1ALX6_CARAN
MVPPRGRKMNTGLRREDAARDRMKEYGFEKHVIDKSIKKVLQVYGEDQWFLIEEANYVALLSVCLKKQEEQEEEKKAGKAVMDSEDYANKSVGGAESSHRGWGGSEEEEEETDPDEDSDSDDDDDEIIQLTPEPLCEELKQLLRESSKR